MRHAILPARYRQQIDQAQTYYRHAANLVPCNGGFDCLKLLVNLNITVIFCNRKNFHFNIWNSVMTTLPKPSSYSFDTSFPSHYLYSKIMYVSWYMYIEWIIKECYRWFLDLNWTPGRSQLMFCCCVCSSGQPYNQLAILEAAKGNKLSTVFYYVRSIAVKHPFPVASTNLEKFFNKLVRDSWVFCFTCFLGMTCVMFLFVLALSVKVHGLWITVVEKVMHLQLLLQNQLNCIAEVSMRDVFSMVGVDGGM